MPKLRVLVHRQLPHEESPGTLRAYVETPYINGAGVSTWRRGSNLLYRAARVTKMDKAIEIADAVLLADYKLIEPPEIEYVIEDPAK